MIPTDKPSKNIKIKWINPFKESATPLTAKLEDYIVFFEKPFLKFERLLETYLAFAPKGFTSFCSSMPIWLREKWNDTTKIC